MDNRRKYIISAIVILTVALLGFFLIRQTESKDKALNEPQKGQQQSDKEVVYNSLLAYAYKREISPTIITDDLHEAGKSYELWKVDPSNTGDYKTCYIEGTTHTNEKYFSSDELLSLNELPVEQKTLLRKDIGFSLTADRLIASDLTAQLYKTTKQEAERYLQGLLGDKNTLLEFLQVSKGFKAILVTPNLQSFIVLDYSTIEDSEYGVTSIITTTEDCKSVLYQYGISDKSVYRLQ